MIHTIQAIQRLVQPPKIGISTAKRAASG